MTIIAGYAAIFHEKDLHSDIILPDAIQNNYAQEKLKLLWQHDPKMVIGSILEIKNTSFGLWFKADIHEKISYVRDILYLLNNKLVESVSIGFMTNKSKYCQEKSARILEEIALYEISLVTYGAQPKAKCCVIY